MIVIVTRLSDLGPVNIAAQKTDNLPMKTVVLSFRVALAFNLVLTPSLATARQLKTPPSPEKRMAEKMDRLRVATFEYLANQMTMVNGADDFEKWMLSNLKKPDRQDAVHAFKQLKKIERVRRVMDTLVFQADGKAIKVTWPDLRKPNFVMNGVAFDYDASRALKPQIEDWANRASKSSKSAWFSFVLPEAEAVAFAPFLYWAGTVIGAVVVGAATGETFKNGRCWLTKGTSYDGDDCINLRKARLEAQQSGMPTFDAVKNMSGSDNSNVLSKFEGPQWDMQCPSNNDGKDRFLQTRVRTVHVEGGVKTPTSDWIYVWVKLSPKGDPQDMILSTSPEPIKVESVNTKAAAKRLIAHIAFDPTTNRPVSFRVPNPEAARSNNPASILNSPTLNLNLGMDLKPEQKDVILNAVDIVKWAIFRTYNCVTQKVVAEQQAGIESGSPAQPKTEPAKAPPATSQ